MSGALPVPFDARLARAPRDDCARSIVHHSKSFALASRLLPVQARSDAAVVYAWCRRADDAVDLVPASHQLPATKRLQRELDALYAGAASNDVVLNAFGDVVADRNLPSHYPSELLAGMEMDARGTRYDTVDELMLYCYRVAGTVGLMMCHVMGVRDPAALVNAAHLGMAMQLTNISRDVAEDWSRGRLYVPTQLLADAGAPGLSDAVGEPFTPAARLALSRATSALLSLADEYYRSGDRGLFALDFRSALAVRTARHVYSRIGRKIEARGCDPAEPRAFVPTLEKLWLVARAVAESALEMPRRAAMPFVRAPLNDLVRFHDCLRI